MKAISIQILLAFLIPLAGAMGYVHGTFVTKEAFKDKIQNVEKDFVEKSKVVDKNVKAIQNTYALVCGIAINLKLQNAEKICTTRN